MCPCVRVSACLCAFACISFVINRSECFCARSKTNANANRSRLSAYLFDTCKGAYFCNCVRVSCVSVFVSVCVCVCVCVCAHVGECLCVMTQIVAVCQLTLMTSSVFSVERFGWCDALHFTLGEVNVLC